MPAKVNRDSIRYLRSLVRDHQEKYGSSTEASPLTCAEVLSLLDEIERLRGEVAAASEPNDFDVPNYD